MKNSIENLGKKLKFSIVFPRKSLAGAPPQTPLGGLSPPQTPPPGGGAQHPTPPTPRTPPAQDALGVIPPHPPRGGERRANARLIFLLLTSSLPFLLFTLVGKCFPIKVKRRGGGGRERERGGDYY